VANVSLNFQKYNKATNNYEGCKKYEDYENHEGCEKYENYEDYEGYESYEGYRALLFKVICILL
jgi:hypothetical protein